MAMEASMARRCLGRILAASLMVLATIQGDAAGGDEDKGRREAGRKALEAGDFDTAEEQMKLAILEAKKLGPDHLPELVEAYVGLSGVYLKQERMTEANILLEQSLLLLAQTPGADSRVLDQVYTNLGSVRLF